MVQTDRFGTTLHDLARDYVVSTLDSPADLVPRF
jgi:hypothetical protein